MINKPWPVIFGTVINNPTLRVDPLITGTTMTPVGILAGAGPDVGPAIRPCG